MRPQRLACIAFAVSVGAMACTGTVDRPARPSDDAANADDDIGSDDDVDTDDDADSPAGDSDLDVPDPVSAITLTVQRAAAGNVMTLHVEVRAQSGTLVAAPGLVIAVSNATASATSSSATGVYDATVTPSIASGVVHIEASAGGVSASRDALVLPRIAGHWGQPEPVPGLVNTPGTEDSAEISPDGQWLLVSTYSPVDLICCLLGGIQPCPAATGSDPQSLACNHSLGPIDGPARPRLPGRERITSTTAIVDRCPSVGLAPPPGPELTFALPPVAAYGFARQADGSFADPFVIAFEMDGCTGAPFGLTFVGPPNGTQAELLFGWNRVDDDPDTGNDVFYVPVTLGADVVLGRYAFSSTTGVSVQNFLPTKLSYPGMELENGNPAYGWGRVWFDTESEAEEDVLSAPFSPASPATPLSTPLRTGVSRKNHEVQPYVDGDRLYFTVNTGAIWSAQHLGSATRIADFTDDRLELGVEGGGLHTGSVAAIGEPSVAHVDGETWLYFVYYARTASGYDGSVGRVRYREAPVAKAIEAELLGHHQAQVDSFTVDYQLFALDRPGTATTYVQWIPPPTERPGPVLVLTRPYDGIDWTNDPIDEAWAALGPGLHPDVNGPNPGTSPKSIVYSPTAPDALAASVLAHVVNGFGVLAIYGRFYAGGDIADDRDDMVNGMLFLSDQALVDRGRIGVYGGSWGGFEALAVAAHAPAAVRPVAGVALFPVSDFEDEMRWALDIPNRTTNLTQRQSYSDFFEPYMRRIVASTGGIPDAPSANYTQWTSTALAAQLQTPFLVVHDAHDTLVPYRQSRTLAQIAPDRIEPLWFPNATPVDLDVLPPSHGGLLATYDVPAYETLASAYLYVRIASSEDYVLVPHVPLAVRALVQAIHGWQVAGIDVSWAAPRLLDLCDSRVLLLDVSGATSGSTGALLVAVLVNEAWGTTYDPAAVCAQLAVGLPPP